IVNETGIIFGCKNNDKIIGFVWFFIKNNTFPKTIHVNHFVVSEEFRGKGLGKDLWEKVEEFAINNDIEDIELLVSKNNENAVNFYLKSNFEIERFVMKKVL